MANFKMWRACVLVLVVKYTSDQEVLNHLKPSQLGGETAKQMDKFRKFTCSEYFATGDVCQEQHVRVSNKRLKKGKQHPTN